MKFHTFTLSPVTSARTPRYATNLVPRHGMVLNCSTKFTIILKSYSSSIHGKKFKHMKHDEVQFSCSVPVGVFHHSTPFPCLLLWSCYDDNNWGSLRNHQIRPCEAQADCVVLSSYPQVIFTPHAGPSWSTAIQSVDLVDLADLWRHWH